MKINHAISFSSGRGAPARFSPRVKKTLYQGFNGGGASSFRGLHDVSVSVLNRGGVPEGVILINPDTGFQPDYGPGPEISSGISDSIEMGVRDTLNKNQGMVSIARASLLAFGGLKLGGIGGVALLALAIPDAIMLWDAFVASHRVGDPARLDPGY